MKLVYKTTQNVDTSPEERLLPPNLHHYAISVGFDKATVVDIEGVDEFSIQDDDDSWDAIVWTERGVQLVRLEPYVPDTYTLTLLAMSSVERKEKRGGVVLHQQQDDANFWASIHKGVWDMRALSLDGTKARVMHALTRQALSFVGEWNALAVEALSQNKVREMPRPCSVYGRPCDGPQTCSTQGCIRYKRVMTH